MHYKNGRPALESDPVVVYTNGRAIAGTLHSLNPQSTTCNGQVARAIPGGFTNECITVGHAYHADDAFKAADKTPAPHPTHTPNPQEAIAG